MTSRYYVACETTDWQRDLDKQLLRMGQLNRIVVAAPSSSTQTTS